MMLIRMAIGAGFVGSGRIGSTFIAFYEAIPYPSAKDKPKEVDCLPSSDYIDR